MGLELTTEIEKEDGATEFVNVSERTSHRMSWKSVRYGTLAFAIMKDYNEVRR